MLLYSLSVVGFCLSGNHSQISRAIVAIRVLDINDNAPEFATEYEAFLCENGKPGQVGGIHQGCHCRLPLHLLRNDQPWWIIAYLFHWESTEAGVWPFSETPPLTQHTETEGKSEQSALIRVNHNSELSFMSSSRWHNGSLAKILHKCFAFSFTSILFIQTTTIK